jgi:phosphohistidine phosphatase
VEIYLVQHGKAKSKEEDPERPLTEEGRGEVASVARHAANMGVKVSKILHSGKLRAKQTAEILAEHLSPEGGVAAGEGLSATDDPERARNMAGAAEQPLMMVGHLPHLSRLTSSLVVGNPENEVVKFRKGGIVCLTKTEGNWTLSWFLTPEITK